MKLAGIVWNKMSVDDRKRLLRLLWQSEVIVDVEAKRKWSQILPSTTSKLEDLDWEFILGKQLAP